MTGEIENAKPVAEVDEDEIASARYECCRMGIRYSTNQPNPLGYANWAFSCDHGDVIHLPCDIGDELVEAGWFRKVSDTAKITHPDKHDLPLLRKPPED